MEIKNSTIKVKKVNFYTLDTWNKVIFENHIWVASSIRATKLHHHHYLTLVRLTPYGEKKRKKVFQQDHPVFYEILSSR